MDKLPVKFKEKWIKALRSGKYLQCTDSLMGTAYSKEECDEYDNVIKESDILGEGYCCLGVAGKICGLDMDEWGSVGMLNDVDSNYLPSELPEILTKPYHTIRRDGKEMSVAGKLASMNDEGCTFNEIADYIEKNL
jgi:hypothetical protein